MRTAPGLPGKFASPGAWSPRVGLRGGLRHIAALGSLALFPTVIVSGSFLAALLGTGCGTNEGNGQDNTNGSVTVPTASSAPSTPPVVSTGAATSTASATSTLPNPPASTTSVPTASMTTTPVPSEMGSGGMNGTGGAGGMGGGGTGGAPPMLVQRELLSQTGLYADAATDTLAEGVLPYAPQFQLWSDGAEKRRWIYIPPGMQIDNTNPDEWKFPVGTKLWKEFSRDGVRIETRLIEKLPEERAEEGFEGWLSIAYVWNEELTDASAAPMGLQNARGTTHDVPDQETCGKCHDMRKEKPLGFSAVQLSHSGEGATLQSLSDSGLLKVPSTGDFVVPGDEATRELLGYLHANCGHCHRKRAPTNNRVATMLLWLETPDLASVEATPAYQALVNQQTQSAQGSINLYRIMGGNPEQSEVLRRITERGGEAIAAEGEEILVPMPPVGSELVDEMAVEMVRAWIESLPAPPPMASAPINSTPMPPAPTPAASAP